MSAKIRLDLLLVRRGLSPSRQRAREQIEAGEVRVDGLPVTRPAAQVEVDRAVEVGELGHSWVGRGALKLLGVLDPLGIDATGRVCADLGASTGGFTEVLLHRGATRVYAVDVGHNQLHWRLRSDPRVVSMEGVNARHLEALPEPVSLLVGDLSFISLQLIVPTIVRLLAPGGEAVILVKPQFEAGRDGVGKGGKVRSDAVRTDAIARATAAAQAVGLQLRGGIDSPLAGAKAGNVEYFLHLARPAPPTTATGGMLGG